jgi:hypothetical protein
MIFDAPDRDAVERIAVAMAGFRQAPISRSVTEAGAMPAKVLENIRPTSIAGLAKLVELVTKSSTNSRSAAQSSTSTAWSTKAEKPGGGERHARAPAGRAPEGEAGHCEGRREKRTTSLELATSSLGSSRSTN